MSEEESIRISWQRYGEELDLVAEMLEKVHPVGQYKGLGRLEVALALQQVIENFKQREQCLLAKAGESERLRSEWAKGYYLEADKTEE